MKKLCLCFVMLLTTLAINAVEANLDIRSYEALLEQWRDSTLSVEKAKVWRKYAYMAQKVGRTEDAQTYAQEAYDMFLQLDEKGWASLCLYERSIDYNSIGDTANMRTIVDALEQLAQQDTTPLTQYNYYSVLFAYNTLIDTDVEKLADAGRKSIYYMEQIDDYKLYNIVPAWNYYNQSLVYDLCFSPPLTDSIRKYIDLATASTANMTKFDSVEIMISVGDERAWMHYYENDYALAEKQMLEVLQLVDTIAQTSPASVVSERTEAYAFMCELYSAQQRWKEAYYYKDKHLESYKERYNIDKQRVLDDIQTKYEVAKQQLTLEQAKHREEVLRGLLIIGLLLVLAISSALAAVSFRKREAEEKLYAKALEAENMYATIEQMKIDSVEPLESMREGLLTQIKSLSDKVSFKQKVLQHMQALDLELLRREMSTIEGLSTMDKRYIICFAAGLTAEQVSVIFNISPPSVYTVRYRIRKKYMASKGHLEQKEQIFPW